MARNLFRSLRVLSWVVLPFLFTSYISPGDAKLIDTTSEAIIYEGSYSLKTSGIEDLELNGTIDYVSAVEFSGSGTPFSTLRLNLRNNENKDTHSLGFLICDQDNAKEIQRGSYKVPGKIEGFLNYFDGVFGFANIKALGEQPFFAESGRIVIADVGSVILHGKIDVQLENPEGKRLSIKGNFTAIRRVIE